MTEEQLDAPFESTRDAGSTPATSTIFPSVNRDIYKLLPDYCPHFDVLVEYPNNLHLMAV